MNPHFRFAVISDLHIGLPQTIWQSPKRFHLVEVSIPAFELVLEHLETLDLDFLLLPGDLTQDGEPENHAWLQQRLASLSIPAYVVPGNHDIPRVEATAKNIACQEFPFYYQNHGYKNPEQPYYTCELLPGVQLVALNSNQFDSQGNQLGCLDTEQLQWLEEILPSMDDKLVLVMVHHNVIEHLPNQSQHPLGRRYMLDNAPLLLQILQKYGVKLLFTGHLHVQDIAQAGDIYEITTGSLVSYPHPYRVVESYLDKQGKQQFKVTSHKITGVPGWENLPQISRQWMGDRSYPFMIKLLTTEPLYLPAQDAEKLVEKLRYFWADIAAGDAWFDFPDFPPAARRYFEEFSAVSGDGNYAPIDNNVTLKI